MRDLVFYNATCQHPQGLARLAFPIRRLLRRLLLPFFQRLVSILQEIDGDIGKLSKRQEKLELLPQKYAATADELRAEVAAVLKRQNRLEAFQLDHDALTRRLASLEEHVERLLQRDLAQSTSCTQRSKHSPVAEGSVQS